MALPNRGQKGASGLTGLPGRPGLKGDRGLPGQKGIKGLPGEKGKPFNPSGQQSFFSTKLEGSQPELNAALGFGESVPSDLSARLETGLILSALPSQTHSARPGRAAEGENADQRNVYV